MKKLYILWGVAVAFSVLVSICVVAILLSQQVTEVALLPKWNYQGINDIRAIFAAICAIVAGFAVFAGRRNFFRR